MSFDPQIKFSKKEYGMEVPVVKKEKTQEDKRVEVDLPVRKGCKKQWEALGVEWTSAIQETAFVASAKLPIGWTVRNNVVHDSDKKDFILLDDKGIPRATIWLKMAFYDQAERVQILSSEEAEELSKQYGAESELDKQFQKLLLEYQDILIYTSGIGSRAQTDIDRVWKKLQDFAKKYPEFEKKVPSKQMAVDDGTDGMNSAFNLLLNNHAKNGKVEDCKVQ